MSATTQEQSDDRKGTVYARSPDVNARQVGAETFLSSGPNGTLHRLDEVASAFWSALEQPRTLDAILALFAAAFPDVQPAKLERDLAKLVASLEKRGLVTILRGDAP